MLHTKLVDFGPPVLEKKILKGFTIYWRGHPDAADQPPFPYPRRLHIKLCFNWPSGFGGEDV